MSINDVPIDVLAGHIVARLNLFDLLRVKIVSKLWQLAANRAIRSAKMTKSEAMRLRKINDEGLLRLIEAQSVHLYYAKAITCLSSAFYGPKSLTIEGMKINGPGSFTSLTHLAIKWECTITDEGLKSIIECSPNLYCLELCDMATVDSKSYIWPPLAIKVLKLKYCRVLNNFLSAICNEKNRPELIYLHRTDITRYVDLECLKWAKKIEYTYHRSQHIPTYVQNRLLTLTNITYVKICNENSGITVAIMANNPNLVKLCVFFSPPLRPPLANLRTIEIISRDIDPKCFPLLNQVEYIRIVNYNITPIDIKGLIIGRTRPLRALELTDMANCTQGDIIGLISPHLKKLAIELPNVANILPLITHLDTLVLYCPNLADDDLVYLQNIKSLEIDGQHITNKGLYWLRNVDFINMRANNITNEGLYCLHKALRLILWDATQLTNEAYRILDHVPELEIYYHK
jgi:hypothetical protein